MLKQITLGNNTSEITIVVVDTELTDKIEIMKAYLRYQTKDGYSSDLYCKDWTEDSYRDNLDWERVYFEIDDLEVIKL